MKLTTGEINKLFLGTNKREGPPALFYRMWKIWDNGKVWECSKKKQVTEEIYKFFFHTDDKGRNVWHLEAKCCISGTSQ